jgi:hypothetical protein
LGADISLYNNQPQTAEGIDFAKMQQDSGSVIVKAGQNQHPMN